MSDSEPIAEVAAKEPQVNDWLFQAFVAMADKNGIEVPVTVSCGGVMISGLLTTMEQFLVSLPEQVGGTTGEIVGETRAKMADFAKMHREKISQKPAHPMDPERMMYRYFHLKGARYLLSGRPVECKNGGWWRGRTEKVDGFRFGRLF